MSVALPCWGFGDLEFEFYLACAAYSYTAVVITDREHSDNHQSPHEARASGPMAPCTSSGCGKCSGSLHRRLAPTEMKP